MNDAGSAAPGYPWHEALVVLSGGSPTPGPEVDALDGEDLVLAGDPVDAG
jgi:hypothetical protein